jgi:hypothetical protein
MGIDNSDGDAFKIGNSADFSGTDYLTINATTGLLTLSGGLTTAAAITMTTASTAVLNMDAGNNTNLIRASGNNRIFLSPSAGTIFYDSSGNSAATVSPAGTSAPGDTTIMTREKGDARYGNNPEAISFDGTGTISIIASTGRIDSIVDNGVGNYTINFTEDLGDYAVSGSVNGLGVVSTNGKTGTSVDIRTTDTSSDAATDYSVIDVIIQPIV